MKLIFLDIDGVLNDHTQHKNMHCGTNVECVSQFNRILDVVPEAKIVISSAWRYMILRGDVTVLGFEILLQTHGVKCHDRVIGCTREDGNAEDKSHYHDESELWKKVGPKWRVQQIRDWVSENDCDRFVVIDDLPLEIDELYMTDGTKGLTASDADEIIRRLKAC